MLWAGHKKYKWQICAICNKHGDHVPFSLPKYRTGGKLKSMLVFCSADTHYYVNGMYILYIYISIHVYMFEGSYACAYVCMWDINTHIIHMYVSIYVCMNACMYASMSACVYIYTITMYIFRYVYRKTYTSMMYIGRHVYIYIHVCIHTFLCMYTYR